MSSQGPWCTHIETFPAAAIPNKEKLFDTLQEVYGRGNYLVEVLENGFRVIVPGYNRPNIKKELENHRVFEMENPTEKPNEGPAAKGPENQRQQPNEGPVAKPVQENPKGKGKEAAPDKKNENTRSKGKENA